MNTILFSELIRRKNKVLIVNKLSKEKSISKQALIIFKSDLFQLGYSIDSALEKQLSFLSLEEFLSVHKNLSNVLKELVGANVQYSPLLEDFIRNDYNPSLIKLPVFEDNKIKVLSLGLKNDLDSIFYNLLSSKTNISELDKSFVINYIKEFGANFDFPETIPLKENIGLLFFCLKDILSEDKLLDSFSNYVNTATDVLRIATAIVNNGDSSLSTSVKFKLNNKERRLICSFLERISFVEEDMKRYINRWKRIGELIHIGNKKHRYPRTFKAFDLIRNNPSLIHSFHGKVDNYLNDLNIVNLKRKVKTNSNLESFLNLLSSRPGEFARLLDLLLRKTHLDLHDKIINAFEKISLKVSSTVLLQLKGNLKYRNKKESFRYFLPKGNISKIQYLDNSNRDLIPESSLIKLNNVINNSLINKYSSKEKYNNVYINKDLLSNIIIPSSLRSSSNSNKLLTRGSRIKIDTDKYIRLFLWWTNREQERVDIDLSAIGFNDNFEYVSHIDYTCLDGVVGHHSGDFTDAPMPLGASEFIDLDKEAILSKGIRYVSMNVYSFTGQPFSSITAFAGVMERNSIKSNEIYVPSTVSLKYSLSGDSQISMPLIFDLESSEIIWSDIYLNREIYFGSNVNSTKHNVTKMLEAVNDLKNKKVNLYELALLNLENRANNIHFDKKEDVEYDLILDKEFCNNLDEIIANWL